MYHKKKHPKIIVDTIKYDDVWNLLISDPKVPGWINNNHKDKLWCVIYPIILQYVIDLSVSDAVIDNITAEKFSNWIKGGGQSGLAVKFMSQFLVDIDSYDGFSGQ